MSTQAWRRARRRRVLPGFPWTGTFETVEAAHNYVGGDRIQCLLCGKRYRALTGHLVRIHDTDETSYKQRFGIPYGCGLVSGPTFDKLSINAHKIMARHDYHLAALERGRQRHQESLEYRPPVSTVARQRRERIGTICSTPASLRPCASCGVDVEVSGSRVFYEDESIHCKQCLKYPVREDGSVAFDAKARERLAEWVTDNAARAKEYNKAKNWWTWRTNPYPLLEYAAKWGARLRITPALQEAVKLIEAGARPVALDYKPK